MDPLFGFMDDISVHHPEESTGVGEYTISYPTDQSDHYHLQHSTNAPISNAPETSAQVVHVVSENSQNEKQIYVIKLENFLKEDGNPGGTATIKFEPGDTQVQEGNNETKSSRLSEEESSSESSGSGEDDGDEPEEPEETEPGPDPFCVISPEAVMAMAQSVGVDLNEDDASELGCLAMNKLRNAILIAMQFSQNENSEGITVEHFAKAEEQLGSPGIGQQSVFRETAFKYAGGVSIIDDGPEIDLYASVHQQNISELTLDEADPILNVHHLRTHDCMETSAFSNLQLYDELIAECCEESNKLKGSEEISEDVETPEAEPGSSKSLASEDAINKTTISDPESNSILNNTSVEDSESSEDEDVTNAINTLINGSDNSETGKEKDESARQESCEPSESSRINLAPEWASYLQMLIEQVMTHDYNQTTVCGISSDFKRILKDIRQHGIHPVVHILCDVFRDYLREPTLNRASIVNILSIVDALVCSYSEPTITQMTDLGCLLIEILILPPPCEIHQFLAHVFMKIMKNCNELLTWTCTYVTELLKGISETSFDQIREPFKSTMHGALCLVNGLEELNIQVAQEFGWHSCVLNFSRSHASVFDGEAYSPTVQDSFLEEEILKFYHNFIKNYTNLVPPVELSRIQECISSLYGERFSSFAPSEPPIMVSISKNVSTGSKNKSLNRKTCCVFRKIIYKDKEIIIPCRKLVK